MVTLASICLWSLRKTAVSSPRVLPRRSHCNAARPCSRARGLEPAEAVIVQHLGDPPAALQLDSAPRRQGRRRRHRGAVGDRRLRRILLAVLIRDVSDDAAALRPRYLDALCCHLFFWCGLRLGKVGRSRCCGGYRSFPVALCVGVCSLFSGCSQSCRFRPLCRVDNAPRRILCSRGSSHGSYQIEHERHTRHCGHGFWFLGVSSRRTAENVHGENKRA